MGIQITDLTDRQRGLLSPQDRKALGKAGMTSDEASALYVARSEKELQRSLSDLLRRRGYLPTVQRMDKRSNIATGMPDFSFSVKGRAVYWECKLPGCKPDEDQEAVIAQLRSAPSYAIVKVIRSYKEGLDHLDELEAMS